MRSVTWKIWFFSIVVALTLGSAASSQTTTSRLDGSVKDQTGAAIFGATVTLTNIQTNETVTTTTSEQGLFVFPQVRSGFYRVSAEAAGFKKVVVENVKVEISIPATVNFTLEVGEITEVVEVTASEGQTVINTVNAELNTIITRRQILDLPLNGRNPLELAGLQAGVTTNTNVRGASVNGLRGSYNNLTQDGINIQDNFIRTDGFFGITAPSVENVAEFSITTQNIGADAGIGVAQVKLVTPSGTNAYHGSAFEFLRNTSLDANDFFNNLNGIPREKLIRNQFGYTMGGPIFKNKLFFFGYYQGTRERRSDTLLRSTLTGPARQGLFTYRRADNGELETVNLLQLAGVQADPFLANLISQTPTPNDFTVGDDFNFAGFRFNSSVIDDDDLWGFRIDFHPWEKHQFEAVFQEFRSRFPNDTFNDIGETFPGIPGGGQSSVRRLGSYAWRWTPSATVTNELRWGFQRAPVKFTNTQTFPEGFRINFPITSNPVRNFLPQGRNTPVYELIDNVNWIKGNHNLRFGGHIRWVDANTFNFGPDVIPSFTLGFGGANSNPISTPDFPGGIATDDFNNASDILALLSGLIESGSQTFNVTGQTSGFVADAPERRNLRQRFLNFYGGDTWRMRPSLTLNFGLRWEWHTVPTEENALALLPQGGVAGLRDPMAVLDFAGDADGRGFFDDDLNNFAPSFGFAWSPSFDTGWLRRIFGAEGKTSIRGGYSISYVVDSNFTAVQNAFSANDGLQQNVTSFALRGTISNLMASGQTSLPAPSFMVPRTLVDNLATDPLTGLFTIDEDLRTPYVQQWTLSLEREILPDTAIEIRYVGNRGTKLVRAIDINQVNVVNNGFAADVLRARRNLMNFGRPDAREGEPLQVFPLLAFRGRTVLRNATVQNQIMQGAAGDIVIFLLQNRNTVFNPQAGAQIGADFFFPNGNALFADFVGNNSWSTYHSLQFEARRRFSQGLWFQFNYTFGRAFTDFAGTAANFDAFLDINRPELEKRRPNFDVTHTANLNFVYELPIGSGHRFLAGPRGIWGKLLDGWQINGILQGRSGPPISIISGRSTFNRTGRNDSNTVFTTLTREQLQKMTGVFHLPGTGEPVLFDPRLIGPDGRANPEFFMNPDAGQVGTLGLTPVSGPQFFNVDFSVIKRTRWKTFLSEDTNLEFRAEFFNIFNNTNFAQGFFQDAFGNIPEDINGVNFGRIVAAFDPRIIQFAFKVNF